MTDPYEVRVTARAVRDMRQLPEKIATACVEFVFRPLAVEPHRLGKPLTGQLKGLRSARRGSYRVIYRISADTSAIEIVHIDHRSTVYR
ncbi:MAG: type II toxin-antitoxin system RelE/ParE family toxin [Pseudonocardiaceae bacterium]|nr:type II toxin-antitoxin system RelE/ParE family toxin [Pseudonocardiaceae bacterium]